MPPTLSPDSLSTVPGLRTLRVCVPTFLLPNVVLPEPPGGVPESDAFEGEFYEQAKQMALATIQRRLDHGGGLPVPSLHGNGRCYPSRSGSDLPPVAALEIEDQWPSTKLCLEEQRRDAEAAVSGGS